MSDERPPQPCKTLNQHLGRIMMFGSCACQKGVDLKPVKE